VLSAWLTTEWLQDSYRVYSGLTAKGLGGASIVIYIVTLHM